MEFSYLSVPSAVLALILLIQSNAEDNGLALTPPMGFNDWERFRCNIDCVNDPDNCISEKLFMSIADALVSNGYRDAGYHYVNIDDCWMSMARDNTTGRLVADPQRFPSGMPALSDYMHTRGLKLGIYGDIGTHTCGGFPGTQGYEQIDAQTYADWKIDLLKLDGCYRDPKTFDQVYPLMSIYLNATGRPILYSCSWPAYQVDQKIPPNYTSIGHYCNIWRNYGDIQDSFDSILDIIQWYGDNQNSLRSASGPGHWNDPDMLIVGDYGLSIDQAKSQFAIWAVLAAPLFISSDVRNMRPEFQEILLNKDIIAVNQDGLSIMGERLSNVYQTQGVEVWRRAVLPVATMRTKTHSNTNYTAVSYALVFFSRRTDGMPIPYRVSLSSLGLTDAAGYHVQDLYTDFDYGVLQPAAILKLNINPGGAVVMLKATLQHTNVKSVQELSPTLLSQIRRQEQQDYWSKAKYQQQRAEKPGYILFEPSVYQRHNFVLPPQSPSTAQEEVPPMHVDVAKSSASELSAVDNNNNDDDAENTETADAPAVKKPEARVDRTLIIEEHVSMVDIDDDESNKGGRRRHGTVEKLRNALHLTTSRRRGSHGSGGDSRDKEEIAPLLQQINWLLIGIFCALCAWACLTLIRRRRYGGSLPMQYFWRNLRHHGGGATATTNNNKWLPVSTTSASGAVGGMEKAPAYSGRVSID